MLINEKRISVFHLTTFRRPGCRRKRAQASRRGRIGSTYPKGFKSPSGQERAISSSAQDLRASPMKEKRCRRFSTPDLIRAISSSAGLATSAERKVPRATCNEREARSSPRHLQRARSAKFPAPLATSAKREVPRATCNEREARSSPRDLQRARSAKFPAPLATSAKREVPRATCNERGARSSPRRI